MRSTLLLSVLAVGLGGCGDHHGGPPGEDMAMPSDDMSAVVDMMIPNDSKQLVTFTMFAQDFAQAICAHYMACGQLDSAQMSACIENNLRHTGWDQDVSIMKNRMQINELQCLNALGAARCDFSDLGQWATRCLDFLYTGLVATGGACVADSECMSGFCQHGGSDGGMITQVTGCPGTCATPKATGAPCRLNFECGTDSFCDSAGTKKCVKLASAGQPCVNFFGVGTGPNCQFGLMCPTFATNPTCVAPTMQTMLHGACDPFQGASTPTPTCGTGMYCQLQYTADAASTCTGAPGDCSSVYGAYCDTGSGKCMNPSGGKCETKIAAGADCNVHNDSFSAYANDQCADGSACMQVGAQTKATCQAFGSANADCTADAQCKVGLYCKTGKCTPWFSDGQVCDSTYHCPSQTQQNVCIADNADAGAVTTCQVTKSFGNSCIPGFEDSLCEPSDLPGSTACVPNGSGGGSCAPKCF